jgi:rhodanese-related sulfurtransferase
MVVSASSIILKTREKNEFLVSHISGAQCVGYESFNMKKVKNIPKDAQIIIYCSLGVRSEKVGEKMIEEGYTNVYNLSGGIFEWVFRELPIVDDKGKRTLKVHTYNEEWSRWLLKGEITY